MSPIVGRLITRKEGVSALLKDKIDACLSVCLPSFHPALVCAPSYGCGKKPVADRAPIVPSDRPCPGRCAITTPSAKAVKPAFVVRRAESCCVPNPARISVSRCLPRCGSNSPHRPHRKVSEASWKLKLGAEARDTHNSENPDMLLAISLKAVASLASSRTSE